MFPGNIVSINVAAKLYLYYKKLGGIHKHVLEFVGSVVTLAMVDTTLFKTGGTLLLISVYMCPFTNDSDLINIFIKNVLLCTSSSVYASFSHC